jgi:CYTH domain-containing protein
MENPSAPPGKSERYARRELERRFLLAAPPAGPVEREAHTFDRYIEGTRLRLRRKTDHTGTDYKLTQKVPAPDGSPGLITTIYLTEAEYHLFAQLPARTLEKKRRVIGGLIVDELGPPLTGLCIAELDVDDEEELRRFVPPPFVVAEVTNDERFTGGRYATMTAPQLEALLAEKGLR